MTASQIASALLVTVGVVVLLLCCVGVLTMPTAMARLHYLAPATQLGAFCIVLAIVLRERLSQGGEKAILLFLLLVTTGAVLTHATGSAIYTREGEALLPPEAKERNT